MLRILKTILFFFLLTDINAQIRLYYKINMQPTLENGSKCGCTRIVSFRLFEHGINTELIVDRNDSRMKDGAWNCQENTDEQRNVNPFSKGSGFLNKSLIPNSLESIVYFWSPGLTGLVYESKKPYNLDFSGNYKITRVAHKGEFSNCEMKAEYDGEFVYVPENLSYPILITPNSNGVINGTSATFSAPMFLKSNFPAEKIKWRILDNGKVIGFPTGHNITYDMSNENKCRTIQAIAYISEDGYDWESKSFAFEFRPETIVSLNIASPSCIESQSQGDMTKYKAKIELENKLTESVYKVSAFDKDNFQLDYTLDKLVPVLYKFDVDKSPYSYKIEQDFGNNLTGCSIWFQNIKLYYPTPISIKEAQFTDIQCFDQKAKLGITIDGNANQYTLSYGDSSKIITKDQPNNIALMTKSRSYNFEIVDENGCKYEQPITFKATEPTKMEATIQVDTAICYRGTANVRITAQGGTPYDVENPYRYAFWPTTGTQISSFYSTKGGVTVYPRVIDKNNCTYSFPVTTLSNPEDFKLSIVKKTDNICPKGTTGNIILSSQSTAKKYSYQYSKDGMQYGSDSLFQALQAGTYTLYSKNQNGCLKDTVVEITQPPFITITPTSLDSVRCFGESNGSITLDVTGGNGYKRIWKNNGSTYLPKSKAYSFSYTYDSLPDIKYWFQAVDSLGCRDSISYRIGTRSRINHSSFLEKPSCYESNNGKATVYVSGGKQPYQHTWLGHPELGAKLQIAGLAKGSYMLQTIDKLSCVKVDTFILTAPPELEVKLEGYPLICKGQTLELDAGTDGDRYDWNSNNGFRATTRKVSLDKTGTYWVHVRDYNSCEGSDTITIQQSDTEYKADFLVATTVAQGDTVVLVNNNVFVDSVHWSMNPINMKPISHSEDNMSQQVTFDELGEQELEMTGYYKGCRDIKKRKILVVSPQERIKSDQSIGIKTSVIKECHLFPNPNDGSFDVVVELHEKGVPVAFTLSSMVTGTILKRLDWKLYPEGKLSFVEDLPEGPYVIHVKVRDEVVALRFLVAYD